MFADYVQFLRSEFLEGEKLVEEEVNENSKPIRTHLGKKPRN